MAIAATLAAVTGGCLNTTNQREVNVVDPALLPPYAWVEVWEHTRATPLRVAEYIRALRAARLVHTRARVISTANVTPACADRASTSAFASEPTGAVDVASSATMTIADVAVCQSPRVTNVVQ